MSLARGHRMLCNTECCRQHVANPNEWPEPRDALDGKGPQRRPQKPLDGLRRLEAVGGGWRRLPNRPGAATVGYKCH